MTDRITVDGIEYVRAYPVAPDRCPHCGAGPRAWTPAQIIAALHAAGPDATSDSWLMTTPEHPNFAVVRRIFGGWNAAKRAAGLPTRKSAATFWTRERILAAINRHAAEHDGEPPTMTEWLHAAPEHPPARVVERRFGSWNAALLAAGYPARGPWGNVIRPVEPGREPLVDVTGFAPELRDRDLDGLAELSGVSADYLSKIRRGKIERARLSFADRIATAIGRPDLLEAA